jgi:hypothetical protein
VTRCYRLHQDVSVYSWGRWYKGQVTRLGRTRVRVEYSTGTGAVYESWFPLNRVMFVVMKGL